MHDLPAKPQCYPVPLPAVNPHKELCFRDGSISLSSRFLEQRTRLFRAKPRWEVGSTRGCLTRPSPKLRKTKLDRGGDCETINKLGLKVARVGAPLSLLRASYWSYRAPTSLLWARQRDWLVAGRWSSQAAIHSLLGSTNGPSYIKYGGTFRLN